MSSWILTPIFVLAAVAFAYGAVTLRHRLCLEWCKRYHQDWTIPVFMASDRKVTIEMCCGKCQRYWEPDEK